MQNTKDRELSDHLRRALGVVTEARQSGRSIRAVAPLHGLNALTVYARAAELRRLGVLPPARAGRATAAEAVPPALRRAKALLEMAAAERVTVSEVAVRAGLRPRTLLAQASALRALGVAVPAFPPGRRKGQGSRAATSAARVDHGVEAIRSGRRREVEAALRHLREAAEAALLVETREMSVQDAAAVLGRPPEALAAEAARLRRLGLSLLRAA